MRTKCRRTWRIALAGTGLLAAGLPGAAAAATPFFFSTGSPDGKMAMGSRPGAGSSVAIEAGDDFVTTDTTALTGASFTGLMPSGAPLSSIQQVRVNVYRVFPLDSNVGRTSGPPTFSTANVPTRVNSPSDVDFTQADSAGGTLSFTSSLLSASFTANNSVLNGIHPKPGQTTGGDGAVTGEEVSFNATLSPPLNLPADHYFFVPQVKLTSGDFLWLSAPKPIVAPGTPFPSGSTDLQAWIRNTPLDPDWLRVGTDVVGGATPPTFNGTFSLSGSACTSTISVSPTTLPDGTTGTPYTAAFSGSGGTAPYSFSETGALPSGLTLTADGTLSGTPGDAGSFPITVTAIDASGCSGSANVTLTIRPPTPAPTHTLTVSKSGSGTGTVTSSPGAIDCGPTCSDDFTEGTAVTLAAAPAADSTFAGWGGACSGTGTCQLTMGADHDVSAAFTAAIPNTKITKAKIRSKKRRATFRFKAIGATTGFRCELKRKHGRRQPKFKPCSSPKTVRRLKAGKYTFKVRALGAAGSDPSPAKRKFTIRPPRKP